MNQIPNIEETHTTKVEDTTAEKLAHEIAKLFDNGFTTPTFGQIEKIEVLLHQQLQKARHDWLREEIVKLEGMRVDPNYSDHWKHGYYQARKIIIDRYHSELDQEVGNPLAGPGSGIIKEVKD